MGEAAKISLKAIGKQDTYLLSKDPDDSLFKYKDMLRHSEFRKYHRSRNVVNPGQVPKWPFGQTLKIEFNPTNMGDLLSNMWLSITIPGITDGNYADQLGRHILKSVTMFVNDIEVEKLYDEWGIIYDDLYLEMSEKVANRALVNRNLGFDKSVGNSIFARQSADLVIPLHFFFSRKYASDEHPTNKPNRPYFPICAIHKQNITFELEFHNQEFYTNTTDTLELQSFNLVTEEITISGQERQYFVTQPMTMINDIVRKHPTVVSELNVDNIKNNLVADIPVKCFHWFLRNTKFENSLISVGDASAEENYYMHNRFNFSSSNNFNETTTFFNPVLESAQFFIYGNKLPNISNTTHNYFKYLVPYRNRLARPIRNIYTYSFAMNPVNVEPSGNLDFSSIESDKTVFDVKLDTTKVDITTDTYTLQMYYTGYLTFKFENGSMSISY